MALSGAAFEFFKYLTKLLLIRYFLRASKFDIDELNRERKGHSKVNIRFWYVNLKTLGDQYDADQY